VGQIRGEQVSIDAELGAANLKSGLIVTVATLFDILAIIYVAANLENGDGMQVKVAGLRPEVELLLCGIPSADEARIGAEEPAAAGGVVHDLVGDSRLRCGGWRLALRLLRRS